tara:strand:- start:651 stop:1781 length:1131 start_codon:yes stop_codon:yes gene_type:complete
MSIKVRLVEDSIEEKSVQQVEQELLDKHEREFNNENTETNSAGVDDGNESSTTTQEQEDVQSKDETQASEISERDVLKYLGNRYGREINSLDELAQVGGEQEALPEDVSKYLQYKKETGRGINDFYELQKDFSDMSPDKLLRDYLTATEKGLDAEDIDGMMDDFRYDEDLDEENDIKKIKLLKKKTIAKAKDYFASEQEKYKIPLESRRDSLSEDEVNKTKEYEQYIAEAKTMEEEFNRKNEVFMKKTDEVFSEFKGFEFAIDDTKIVFSPGDAAELKKNHLNPQSWINKFVDKDSGVMNDAEGYHRSLAMAMNPDKFAKFFYEQGKSASADEQMRKLKNINMTTRSAPEVGQTIDGIQVKSLGNDHGRGLKIRKR